MDERFRSLIICNCVTTDGHHVVRETIVNVDRAPPSELFHIFFKPEKLLVFFAIVAQPSIRFIYRVKVDRS